MQLYTLFDIVIILNLFCMENRKLNSLLIKLMCKVWHGMHSHAKAFSEFVNTKCNKNKKMKSLKMNISRRIFVFPPVRAFLFGQYLFSLSLYLFIINKNAVP